MSRYLPWSGAILIFGLSVIGIGGMSMADGENSTTSADREMIYSQIHERALGTAGVLQPEWLPGLPTVAIPGEQNAVDPLLITSATGTLTVAAESRGSDGSSIVVSHSTDGGESWASPREIARAANGNRISAGAAGALPSGRVVMARHAGSDRPGEVKWTREDPPGVHHYSWSGFRRRSRLNVLLSDDEGKTWRPASCDTRRGPVTPAAMGRLLQEKGALWLAVYGPADRKEMDAALSGVGLLRSDDDGESWQFSHWVARADKEKGIAYGPGEITVLPDGRWLAMLQGHLRARGAYTKPRVFRTVGSDAGRTWSPPELKMIGPATSLIVLDRDLVMLGSMTNVGGVTYNVFADAGGSLLYQDHAWRGFRTSGGLTLVKHGDEAALGAYTWTRVGTSESEIHVQVLHKRAAAEGKRRWTASAVKPEWRWVMAEGYQIPDMAEAPAGLRPRTVMKLQSGDWMCIGYTGTVETGEASYGVGASGRAVRRAPTIQGPWRKVGDLPIPEEVGNVHDPGTGMGMPSFLWQHSSGRLFLPFSAQGRKDIILTYSDDEGQTWHSVGSMAMITNLPDIREADLMVEAQDGSVVFPMVTGAGGPPGDPSAGAHLFYVRSADGGRTWSEPLFWGRWPTYPPMPYEGLPHGNVGDIRETAMAIVDEKTWLAIYHNMLGGPIPTVWSNTYNAYEDYLAFGALILSRSEDGGRTWQPYFGLSSHEPALAATPDGAVFCASRQMDHGSVWISYDQGRSWQTQEDPVEVPWGRHMMHSSIPVSTYGQWPPGGAPTIRVLDAETVVVITDTGLIPSGRVLPEGYEGSRELHGRVQVRFFRRMPVAP